MKTVAIVDDHLLLAQVLVADLSRHGLASCCVDVDGEIIEQIEELSPDLVVLDLELGDARPRGHDLIESLVTSGAKVVVLSGVSDETTLALCLERGASGILPKDIDFETLIGSIRSCLEGGDVPPIAAERVRLSQALAEHRRVERRRFEPFRQLTAREVDVLRALMSGETAAEVSAGAVVSLSTVRTQIKSILRKLEVGSQLQAVVLAHEVGWFDAANEKVLQD